MESRSNEPDLEDRKTEWNARLVVRVPLLWTNNAHPCFSNPCRHREGKDFHFRAPILFLYALLSRYANDRNERRKNWERETFVWRELPDISIESRWLPVTILLDFSFFFLLKSNGVSKRCQMILWFFFFDSWSKKSRIRNFNGVYSSFIIRGTRVTLKSEIKSIIL